MITQQVRKVGNSLVVTIPKAESDRLNISEGDYISMEVNKMELSPVLSPELQRIMDSDLPGLKETLNYLKDR